MILAWTEDGWEDYASWTSDPKRLRRINDLIEEIERSPFRGTGKPEPLKGNLAGYWSRRITQEHHLVYAVEDCPLTVIQARLHY